MDTRICARVCAIFIEILDHRWLRGHEVLAITKIQKFYHFYNSLVPFYKMKIYPFLVVVLTSSYFSLSSDKSRKVEVVKFTNVKFYNFTFKFFMLMIRDMVKKNYENDDDDVVNDC
jgi:hypothetical protein